MSGSSTSISLDKPIELFYAGTHTDFRRKVVSISKPELEQAVAWFNTTNQRLPLVVGHPDSEEDNFGRASRLAMQGDRVVITEVEELDPTFRKIVNSGELPKVSAKIRLQGHPNNRSGGIEFQHAGFFGKSRVALDKLKEAAFSAAANDREFYFMDDEMQEREAEFAAEKAAFEREVAAFRRAQTVEPVIEELVRDGKLLPGEKQGFVALFAGMPDDFEIAFKAPSGEVNQSGGDFLMSFLKALKPRVVYGEVTAPVATEPKTAKFAAPKGWQVKQDGLDLHSKAVAFCKANNLNPENQSEYVQAVEAVVNG